MASYLIFSREKSLDSKELSIYSSQVPSTLAGHEVKILALYGPHQDLEGAPSEGIVVLEFPTTRAAMAWYNSPAYREVREHRFKGADFRVALIEGVQ
jgi:uncharacterized protein (DUF1330 family)